MYKIATNQCLTMLAQRKRRALPVDIGSGDGSPTESEWLGPFPAMIASSVGSPAERYDELESIELAFVAVLQELPSSQRAVLLLRDVIGFSSRETAELLDTTSVSVNSTLQRARATLGSRSPETTQRAAMARLGGDGLRRLAEQYAAAWEAGDIDAIVALLAGDARYSMPPVEEWFQGRDAIRSFLVSGPLQYRWRFVRTIANGQLAFGTYMWDDEHGVFRAAALDVIALRDDQIAEVVSFLTPEIFTAFGLTETLP